MKLLQVTNSSIKGYHVFKIKPHWAIKMLVVPENDNKYDGNAMIIKMPMLNDIDEGFRDEITGNGEGQRVSDIAGKIVGRVPANLSYMFRKLLKDFKVKNIECVCEGNPKHSCTPNFKQSFLKGKKT